MLDYLFAVVLDSHPFHRLETEHRPSFTFLYTFSWQRWFLSGGKFLPLPPRHPFTYDLLGFLLQVPRDAPTWTLAICGNLSSLQPGGQDNKPPAFVLFFGGPEPDGKGDRLQGEMKSEALRYIQSLAGEMGPTSKKAVGMIKWRFIDVSTDHAAGRFCQTYLWPLSGVHGQQLCATYAAPAPIVRSLPLGAGGFGKSFSVC